MIKIKATHKTDEVSFPLLMIREDQGLIVYALGFMDAHQEEVKCLILDSGSSPFEQSMVLRGFDYGKLTPYKGTIELSNI